MARNEFETEMGKMLRGLFVVAERLDDVAFNRLGGRQVKKKPYDFFGATKTGSFWGAEVKRVKSHLFPLRNFAEHQHEALAALSENNCHAWVLINWRTAKVGGKRGTGIAIWVPYFFFDTVCNRVQRDGRKSVQPADFPNNWFLARVPGGWMPHVEHPFYRYA